MIPRDTFCSVGIRYLAQTVPQTMCLKSLPEMAHFGHSSKTIFRCTLTPVLGMRSLSEKSQSQYFPSHPPQGQLTPEILARRRLSKSTRPSWGYRVRAWQRKTTNTHPTQHTENTGCWAGRGERVGGRHSLVGRGLLCLPVLFCFGEGMWSTGAGHRESKQKAAVMRLLGTLYV